MSSLRHLSWNRPAAPARLLVVLSLCSACDSSPKSTTTQGAPGAEAKTPSSPPSATAASRDPHASAQATAALTWTKPAPWKEVPARGMRKANYVAEGTDGAAELTIFYFGPGSGGSTEANIQRWIGQFSGVPEGAVRRDQLEVEGLRVLTVALEGGTFASGMPGQKTEPRENWGMRAAVVETPLGPYFFKLVGPAKTVLTEAERFGELLKSVRSQ